MFRDTEFGIEVGSNRGQAFGIIKSDVSTTGCERHEPIKCTAVEQMPAKSFSHAARDRALPRATRPIERHDRYVDSADHQAVPSPTGCKVTPSDSRHSAKPGNDVAIDSVFLMSTGPSATDPATANDIATR